MYLKQLSLAVLCGFVVLACSHVEAAILKTEDFSYADGDLVGNGDWVNHSGSGSFIQVASGAAVLVHGSDSREDANTSFAVQSAGVLTASFDLTVDASAPIDETDNEYFAHFYPSDDGFDFRARTDIVAPSGSGDYSIGISTDSSTAELSLPTDFAYGDIVPVSITFDLSGGTASLTAGGNTVNTTAVSLGQVIDAFALRQSNSSQDETITIDNLEISHVPVPEPASLMLTLVGLIGLGVVRRK